MKNIHYKKLFLLIIFILLNFSFIFASENADGSIYLHGTVTNIIDDKTDHENMIRTQIVEVQITEKNYDSQLITITHDINMAYIHQLIVSPNDQVIIWTTKDDISFENCRIYSFGRDNYLLYLGGVFGFLILIIGGRKGALSMLSLGITIALIFLIFFPLIMNGRSPIQVALIVCIISTCVTLITIGHLNPKTYAAIIGTIGGIVVTVFLIYIFGYLTHITGLQDENVEALSYLPNANHFNFREILYAGIIIGALGAVMDVCMSIASSMDELCQTNPKLSNFHLYISGMRIGKDIMGTMTNTLILAYVGTSIPLILVFYTYGYSLTQFINSDRIAVEILRALTSSAGLVLSIPITSFSYLVFRRKSTRRCRK